jgi:hypothetical protein
MEYRVQVTPANDRRVRIEQEIAAAKGQDAAKSYPFTFRDKAIDLPVVRLPIDSLIYRLDNGRTGLRQVEWIRKHNLPQDYFLKAEEDASAQQIQHNILLELANDKRGDIYKEMQYKGRQTEYLLVTNSGVVVNGNRRLAAMRQLLIEDSAHCASFSHVDVAVLPPETTRLDIEDIESELQETPETKLEYDWISRRIKMRYRRDVLKFSPDRLVKIYRLKREQINKEIQQLQIAEDYLERYLGKPLEYELVEDAEEIFRQLQQALESKSSELEDVARLMAFPLIKERRNLGDRAYAFRHVFGSDAAEVLERMADEEEIILGEPEESTDAPDAKDDDDPLADITDRSGDHYKNLKPLLGNLESSLAVAEQLVAISSTIRQERKDGGRKMVALRNAEQANRFVHEIDLSNADPETIPSIEAQLDTCIKQAQKIIQDIAKRKNAGIEA